MLHGCCRGHPMWGALPVNGMPSGVLEVYARTHTAGAREAEEVHTNCPFRRHTHTHRRGNQGRGGTHTRTAGASEAEEVHTRKRTAGASEGAPHMGCLHGFELVRFGFGSLVVLDGQR